MKKSLMTILFSLFCFGSLLTTVHAEPPAAVRIQTVVQHAQPADPATGGILINIYYFLVDGHDRVLADAAVEENSLAVTLDGQPQGAVTAVTTNTPLNVAMALDVSTSMQDHLDEMVSAVTTATNSAPATTRFGLLFFDHEIHPPQQFTTDRHLLQDDLRGLTIPSERYTCIYDAANEAIKSLLPIIEQAPATRRAVILFTDGENKPAPHMDCRYETEDTQTIIEFAQEHQIALYTIGFGRDADVSLLQTLADGTGGLALIGHDSMEQKFSEVVQVLNSQHVAQTTIFPETAGSHTLALNLRVRGDQQESLPIEAASMIIETIAAPASQATVEIKEHRYLPTDRQMTITVNSKNAAAIECVTFKLRDLETKETVASSKECDLVEGELSHLLQDLPPLVIGRDYQLEIDDGGQLLCQPDENGNEETPCVRVFKIPAPEALFDFTVQPRPEAQQLQITLNLLDRDFTPVKYYATIFQGGIEVRSFTEVWQTPSDTIALAFYPNAASNAGGDSPKYDIEIELEGLDGRGEVVRSEQLKQDVLIPLPIPPTFWQRLSGWLNQRPFLSALTSLAVMIACLAYFGRAWLEKKLPATPFLASQNIYRRPESPLKPVTQLADKDWPSSDPQPPRPTAPQTHVPGAAPPTLQIVEAPTQLPSDFIAVEPLPFRIGREGCHLTIGDERTSRTHALIQRIGRQYFITDLGSINGTFLNDQTEKLTPNMRWPLADQDRIRLGTTIELSFNTNTV